MGIDNSALNDPFKIAASVALGTSDVFLLDEIACNIGIGLSALGITVGINNTGIGNLAGLG